MLQVVREVHERSSRYEKVAPWYGKRTCESKACAAWKSLAKTGRGPQRRRWANPGTSPRWKRTRKAGTNVRKNGDPRGWRRKDLEQRDEALASQEKQLQAQSRQRMELAGVVGSIEDFCERVRGGLTEATFEQRRKLVELLIDRVIVTEEEVEIRYVIPTSPESEHVRFCHLRSDYLHHPPVSPQSLEPSLVTRLRRTARHRARG